MCGCNSRHSPGECLQQLAADNQTLVKPQQADSNQIFCPFHPSSDSDSIFISSLSLLRGFLKPVWVSFLSVFFASVFFCKSTKSSLNLCSRRTSAWSRSCTTPVNRTSSDCVRTWPSATRRSAATHTYLFISQITKLRNLFSGDKMLNISLFFIAISVRSHIM